MKNLKLTLILAFTALFLSSITSYAVEKSVVIKGSDTMVLLGQAWAEAYMKTHPNTAISVQGGGSGTGISALINKSTDICMASRSMSGKEIGQCKDRNFVPKVIAVALDGITLAVNSSNNIDVLTIDQLKGIYTGKITNWKQVGGSDKPIIAISRESSSGTYVYFKEHVLANQNYAPSILLAPSTKYIQAEISKNVNAIGYGGVAYFKNKKNIKILRIASKKGAIAVEPTNSNIKSGKYPISRDLYLYTAGKPIGEAASFIKYVMSEEGQVIVERVGYDRIK